MAVTSNPEASAICDLMRFFLCDLKLSAEQVAKLDPKKLKQLYKGADKLVLSSYRKLQAGVRPEELREWWDAQFPPDLVGTLATTAREPGDRAAGDDPVDDVPARMIDVELPHDDVPVTR